MRRPLAAASSFAVSILIAAVMVGVQLVPSTTLSPEAAHTAQDDGDDRPNDADMMFATMMIPHHQQAVELSRILADTAGIDDISVALAAFIERDQGREITDMQAWLDAWRRTGIMRHHHSDGAMAGMANADQVAELAAAEGVHAEQLFLDLMIVHHEGALVMTRQALAAGNNSYIRALAKHVAAEQEREIEAMQARRDTL
ncbi:DUF305 domain-containing protein [Herbiconiux ginsengi]|uniref:Uncharacterized conserved protein, DUF305 family n=1 Tax=Herbiconiux ginsengi TaxID=381665 RepID=A0A1H3TZX3_9MICO|nr:DUF305 domain-containing protein [Herbiconiux ginsengi]SDZ55753.1 Uncharacterized conserved protein, DUF305 family [Herbiconiux ginsengi]